MLIRTLFSDFADDCFGVYHFSSVLHKKGGLKALCAYWIRVKLFENKSNYVQFMAYKQWKGEDSHSDVPNSSVQPINSYSTCNNLKMS